MKPLSSFLFALLLAWLAGSGMPGTAYGAQGAPVIRHEPALVGVRGQSLAIRASVTADAVQKAVYLYYSVSRDAAPYKLTMLSTGSDGYIVTIPGALLGGATQVTYYIEAVAGGDVSAETLWYTVDLRTPEDGGEARGAAPEKNLKWVKPALYAGGAAVLIGGAALLASGRDKGGSAPPPPASTNSGGGTVTNAGSYVGTANTGYELGSAKPTWSTTAIRILVTSDGVVSSDTLRQNSYVEGRLSGQDFLLISAINETNRVGEIRYKGTIIENRISGSISGSDQISGGDGGAYSGNFSATRQ
jgi:hypothetical protein